MYEISGSAGDTAEAVDYESAIVAAKTLVDDGNDHADVYFVLVEGVHLSWVASVESSGELFENQFTTRKIGGRS